MPRAAQVPNGDHSRTAGRSESPAKAGPEHTKTQTRPAPRHHSTGGLPAPGAGG